MAQFGRVPPQITPPASSDDETDYEPEEIVSDYYITRQQAGLRPSARFVSGSSSQPTLGDVGNSSQSAPRTLRCFDLHTQRYLDIPACLPMRGTCYCRDTHGFPDQLVFDVEQERDYYMRERVALIAQNEQFRLDAERHQTEIGHVRAEAEDAQTEVQRLKVEIASMRDKCEVLRFDLEFTEGEHLDAMTAIAMLRDQLRARDTIIARLRRSLRFSDERIAAGQRRARQMYELLEPRTDLPHLPDSAESGASVSQRRRIRELPERSRSGSDDVDVDADDDGSDDDASGDAPEVPAAEPGWITS